MKKALLVLWLCAVVTLQGAKIKTKAEGDPAFTFVGVRTWAWADFGTGDVYMARSSHDDPVAGKLLVDPVITDAILREMGERGLTHAVGAADVTLHYYLIVTAGIEAQQAGQFLPPITDWGVPQFALSTSSLNVITRGSLVLDVASRTLDRVVWRGVAQTDLDTTPTESKRAEILRDAVHELVKRLPLRK